MENELSPRSAWSLPSYKAAANRLCSFREHSKAHRAHFPIIYYPLPRRGALHFKMHLKGKFFKFLHFVFAEKWTERRAPGERETSGGAQPSFVTCSQRSRIWTPNKGSSLCVPYVAVVLPIVITIWRIAKCTFKDMRILLIKDQNLKFVHTVATRD